MPCRIGHQVGDPEDLWSMSRRQILGLSAVTVAGSAALVLANCGTKEQTGEQKEKAKDKLKKEDFIPAFGMLAVLPANVTTIQGTPLPQAGDDCFYIPYYNEYLTKDELTKGLLTCRILILGKPAVTAIAVNLSDQDFPTHAHDTPHSGKPEDLDALLTQLGYARKYGQW